MELTKSKNYQKETLKAVDSWCKEVGITHTLAFFVNGHKLPDAYQDIADLKYIMSTLLHSEEDVTGST